MSDGPIAAVTGGTGFLGRWIVRALNDAGWRTRLLVRRDPVHPQLSHIDYEIVPGDLRDEDGLMRLVKGADAIVHAAGVVKALSRSDFFTANAAGTRRLAAVAAVVAPTARFVHVSSLAAREPGLSHYAASKAAAEAEVLKHGPVDRVIVRPAAVYGPWDRETLAVFRAAAGRFMPLPGGKDARVCLIHASDAASAIALLCRHGQSGRVYELSDACRDGYDWPTIARTASDALGARARPVRVPRLALWAAAGLTGTAAWLSRRPAMFTPQKLRELAHTDWTSADEMQPPADLWRPAIDLPGGFAETARWYRTQGWL